MTPIFHRLTFSRVVNAFCSSSLSCYILYSEDLPWCVVCRLKTGIFLFHRFKIVFSTCAAAYRAAKSRSGADS